MQVDSKSPVCPQRVKTKNTLEGVLTYIINDFVLVEPFLSFAHLCGI